MLIEGIPLADRCTAEAEACAEHAAQLVTTRPGSEGWGVFPGRGGSPRAARRAESSLPLATPRTRGERRLATARAAYNIGGLLRGDTSPGLQRGPPASGRCQTSGARRAVKNLKKSCARRGAATHAGLVDGQAPRGLGRAHGAAAHLGRTRGGGRATTAEPPRKTMPRHAVPPPR